MKRAARLGAVLDLLAEHGEVSVEYLVERFGASAATMRRDLDTLAEQRLLTRTHGGAVAQSVAYELPIRYRTDQASDAKAQIAAVAAAMVTPGGVIGLSGGTTTTAIASAIASHVDEEGVTIVTNAVNIAAQLATRPHVKVVVTGGLIHARSYELVGPFTEQLLDGIQLDLAFIGVDGMDADHGASTHDEREAAVNRKMAQRAHRSIVVADANKLGQKAFAQVGGVELFASIITDSSADEGECAALRAAGFEVVTA